MGTRSGNQVKPVLGLAVLKALAWGTLYTSEELSKQVSCKIQCICVQPFLGFSPSLLASRNGEIRARYKYTDA